jgi:hypothetical protein
MEDLNNTESEIYKKTKENQKLYILTRLKTIKNRYLDDTMGCCGTKETIAKHLNNGPAQNLVQTFFDFKVKNCVLCKGSKGENNIRQLERAHCNIYSRYDLLMMAVNDLWINNDTPIKVGDILKVFIQKHEQCPIYMLCNNCHNKYDN